ncbi:MAG TPA: dihydrolipoamide acetyltransferase family protein [Anaerovoracaceae bacterium]|nr:dihydrolipoamide acetyltransferase family protein [Anaerovoracaceae bacterium]
MAEIVNMPRLGLNETTSVIKEWLVLEGDEVRSGDELFTIETDKTTMAVQAETDGVVLKRLYDNYDVVEVLTPVCIIGEKGENIEELLKSIKATVKPDGDEPVKATETVKEVEPVKETEAAELKPQGTKQESMAQIKRGQAFFSPRARALAEANGLAQEDITPTGAENRILEDDVIQAMKGGLKRPAASETRTVKLSGIRRMIAKNMMHSLASTAQLTSHAIFNASAILNYREKVKRCNGPESGVTIGDMVLFAVSRTLGSYDYMNAHMAGDDEILLFSDVNLGFAVDTDNGLMVPTLFGAQRMSLFEISTKSKGLADKCRSGKILPGEMAGGTFTVSNLGNLGVTDFTPILNPPQIGILGVGTVDYAMKMTSQGMLYYPSGHLSLTYDHRAVDGAPSARFLKAVCDNLENFTNIVEA